MTFRYIYFFKIILPMSGGDYIVELREKTAGNLSCGVHGGDTNT